MMTKFKYVFIHYFNTRRYRASFIIVYYNQLMHNYLITVYVTTVFCVIYNPVSWSGGQSFWLLTTRSRVRFPALPWEFFLVGEDPRGDHGLGS